MSDYQSLAMFGALLLIAAQLGAVSKRPMFTDGFSILLGGLGIVCIVAAGVVWIFG